MYQRAENSEEHMNNKIGKTRERCFITCTGFNNSVSVRKKAPRLTGGFIIVCVKFECKVKINLFLQLPAGNG